MSEARAELPEGWEWVTLGDVAEYHNGRAFKPTEWTNQGLPIIRIQNLNSPDAHLNYFAGELKEQHSIDNGDLLVSWSASLDVYVWQRGKAALNQHIFKVIENPAVIQKEYLYFALKEAMSEIRGQVHGATMKHITKPEFEAFTIPLPPFGEQKAFASLLAKQMAEVDKARAATEAQLEAADLLPSAVLSSIFDGSEIQDSKPTRLGNVLRLRKEVVHPRDNPKGEATFVGLQHVESHTGKRIGEEKADKSKLTGRKPQFYKGDIVYGYLRPYLNKVWIAEFDGLCSVDQYVYSVDTSIADTKYVAWFMLSPVYMRTAPISTTPGQLPRIRTEEVASVEMPLPSLEEQNRIVKIIEEKMTLAQNVGEGLSLQLETINALPASILRQAFTGELTRQPSPEDLRAALTCLAVERLHHRVFFGVVQLMKVLYFAQVHHGIPLGYTMRRHTYGPFDKAVYDLEKGGERQGWFSVDKAVDKQGSRYVPGAELDSLAREAEGTLSRWKDKLVGLLDLAETFDTTGLEALATLHAAWNDLLLEGRQPTDSEIISEVLEHWPGKAEKFQRGELRQYLAYLRATPYIPKGTGQSTRLTHAA